MADTIYTPGVGGLPFGNQNTNPEGSNYATDSEYSPVESNMIEKVLKKVIFDAAPVQYNAMKILFSKTIEDRASDEFSFLEHTFGRSPLEIIAGTQTTAASAAVVAVPGAHVSHTFNLLAGSLSRVSVDDTITYPGNEEGVVVSIVGNVVTVNSRANAGLPGVAAGDVLAIRSTIMADGQNEFNNYSRLDTVTRYNYVQFFLRAQRWGNIELQKQKNLNKTDYLKKDKQELIRQLRYDMFISYFNGHRGEYTLSGNRVAKSMGGIYPTMVDAGASSSNPTLGGLAAAFETLAMATNHKAEGDKRFIYGTHESLHELAKVYKVPGLRYTPTNMTVNLDLQMIEIGGAKYVLVPCELFKEPSCFPAAWAKRLLVLDQDTITPVKMQGFPLIEMNQTDDLSKGTMAQYVDFSVRGNFSIEFNNPPASFIIDIQ